MIKKTLLFFCLYLFIGSSIAQNYHYRLSADFTIKESDGNIDNLTAGKVYYDLNNDILVYNMYFPEKIDWVVHDTSFYTFRDDLLESRYTIPKINEENILHLSLSSTLNDYGLSNTQLYKLDKVIQEVASARQTERGNRADDKVSEAAMEERKKHKYLLKQRLRR